MSVKLCKYCSDPAIYGYSGESPEFCKLHSKDIPSRFNYFKKRCVVIDCQNPRWQRTKFTKYFYCQLHYNTTRLKLKQIKRNKLLQKKLEAKAKEANKLRKSITLIRSDLRPIIPFNVNVNSPTGVSEFQPDIGNILLEVDAIYRNRTLKKVLEKTTKLPLYLDNFCITQNCTNPMNINSFIYCESHDHNSFKKIFESSQLNQSSEFTKFEEIDHLNTIDRFNTFDQRCIYMFGLIAFKYDFQLEDQPEAWIQRLLVIPSAPVFQILKFINSAFGLNMICRELSTIYDTTVTVRQSIDILLEDANEKEYIINLKKLKMLIEEFE